MCISYRPTSLAVGMLDNILFFFFKSLPFFLSPFIRLYDHPLINAVGPQANFL